MTNATLPVSALTHTDSGIIAPESSGYVEITRKPRKPRQRRQINWLDLPRVYGQAGFEADLSGSDKATLAYLYGATVKINRLDDGRRCRVTMVAPTVGG